MAAFPVVSDDEEWFPSKVLDDARDFHGLSAEEQALSFSAFADAYVGSESEAGPEVGTFPE
eukprot:3020922-Pleurochrysis_carterae.AAC.1